MKHFLIVVAVLCSFAFPAAAQESAPRIAQPGNSAEPNIIPALTPSAPLPPAFLGLWTGDWQEKGVRKSEPPMEIEISALTGTSGAGQLKFMTYAMPICTWTWEKSSAINGGEKVPALRGRCGFGELVFMSSARDERVMNITYKNPNSASTVRMTKR